MEHREIRLALAERIPALLAGTGDLPIALRPYQRETLEATRRWLEDPSGTRRGHVSHATGLGKTVIFASLARACTGLRTLIIVPTKTLVEQTARVVVRFTGGIIGHLSSLSRIHDGDDVVAVRGLDHSSVVVTTDATFNRSFAEIAQDFAPHLIVRDECHWGYVEAAQIALAAFPEAAIVGFSATPDFLTTVAKGGSVPVTLENGQVLYGPRDQFAETHFGTLLDRRTVRWGIESGWLAPLAWGRIDFDIALDEVPTVDGPAGPDYDEKSLQDLLGRHWSVMCETIRRLYADSQYELPHRQVFSVCQSVAAAQELAEAIASLGISAACVTGATSDAERNVILEAFKANEIRFLSSVMVLREGWDAPNAEVCMMLRPTKSRVLYEQIIGRPLRLAPDGSYKVALVLDAHFQCTKFSPLSAPMLFGAPGTEIPEGGIVCGPVGERVPDGFGASDVESPFLPKGIRPRIVVVESLETEYWAGEDGAIVVDGLSFLPQYLLSERLPLGRSVLASRLDASGSKVRFVSARTRTGKQTTFYAVEDVRTLCADIIRLEQVGADGTVSVDGRRLLQIEECSEALGIGIGTVRQRVKERAILGTLAWSRGSHRALFYDVEDVRSACADLLARPVVDERQVFEKDGRRWASRGLLKRDLYMTSSMAMSILDKPSVRRLQVRSLAGRKLTLFDREDVERERAAYPELEPSPPAARTHPQANLEGWFDKDGERWYGRTAFRREYGVSDAVFKDRVRTHAVRTCEARTRAGVPRPHYALQDLLAACADAIERVPSVGPDGVVVIGDEPYANVAWFSRKLGIHHSKVNAAIAENAIAGHVALDRIRHKRQVYPIRAVEVALLETASTKIGRQHGDRQPSTDTESRDPLP